MGKGGMCSCSCGREIHSLGIMQHRAKHKRNKEKIIITFSRGDTYSYDFRDDK